MPLKVELKPGERILIGECVITNAGHRAQFVIDGKVPIIREKDIMTAEQANTPAKRIYLSILLMYTSQATPATSTGPISRWCATSSRRRPALGRRSRLSIIKS